MYDLDRDEYALPRRARGCACGHDLPGRCPGPSNCPYNADEPSDEDRAAEEGPRAFSAAEDLASVLDRPSGNWGDQPDALADLTARIAALHAEAVALLGMPRRRTRSGGIAPGLTAADETNLRAVMRDPRYWRDREPAMVRAVAAGFRAAATGETPVDLRALFPAQGSAA